MPGFDALAAAVDRQWCLKFKRSNVDPFALLYAAVECSRECSGISGSASRDKTQEA